MTWQPSRHILYEKVSGHACAISTQPGRHMDEAEPELVFLIPGEPDSTVARKLAAMPDLYEAVQRFVKNNPDEYLGWAPPGHPLREALAVMQHAVRYACQKEGP